MQIQHLRNATLLLEVAGHRLLVDPMLAPAASMPGFKMFGGGRRNNPLVELPPGADDALDRATAVLLTHEHPDHFDRAGLAFARKQGLDVWASPVDAHNLRRKGLRVQELRDGALGMRVELVAQRHGRGLLGWLMGPVTGCYLAAEGEPSVLLTGDAVLTADLLQAIDRLAPDVIVAPAGAANMGLGGDILFSVDELVQLTRGCSAEMVFNHLEALDHCPTTRAQLRERMQREGLSERVHIPDDGEALTFAAPQASRPVTVRQVALRPGLQKRLTSPLTGT